MDRRKFIAATCSTVGMSAIGMPALAQAKTKIRVGYAGRRRTDMAGRGRRGLLTLHRSGLSPHTPCRSPGALTRVTACTLALSPYIVTRYPEASAISLPPCLLRFFRLERLPGGTYTH